MCNKCNPYPDVMNAIPSQVAITFDDDGTAHIGRAIIINGIAYIDNIFLSEHEAFDLAECIKVRKNAVL